MSSLFNDTDDDVTLRTRRAEAAEYGDDHAPSRQVAAQDREVTLNTGMVLAIFFALALVCAVFFGFGYSIGHKSGVIAGAATDAPGNPDTPSSDTAVTATPSAAKPSSGVATIPGYDGNVVIADKTPSKATTPASPAMTKAAAAEVDKVLIDKPAPVVRLPPPAPVNAPAINAPAISAPDGNPVSYVQISAVSHQEDADLLVSALGRRGYHVIQRSQPADHLIHVQIGPFANRKDAEAIKLKLSADGYNAFIK